MPAQRTPGTGSADTESARGAILEAILASIADGVVVADTEGRFVLWNQAAERLVGLGPSDTPPEHWPSHYGVYLPDQVTPYPAERLPLVRAIHGDSVDGDEQFVRNPTAPAGVWLRVTARPLTDAEGRHRGGVVTFRDVTSAKAADSEIARLHAELTERVRQLEAANRELEAFAYTVSHDLRAPLRAMQGFSQALLEDYGSALDETAGEYARRVVGAAERMDVLIGDLLQYSRLTRAELPPRPMSLARAVEEARHQLGAALTERGARITVEEGLPDVLAHARTVVQVLTNLLSNAVKFVAADVEPRVRVRAERRGASVRLWVEDNGIGIAPEHQERIFRVFERLHGLEAYPGTGVGLAIVAKGTERMGGRAGVESAPGAGSRFWVELPADGGAP